MKRRLNLAKDRDYKHGSSEFHRGLVMDSVLQIAKDYDIYNKMETEETNSSGPYIGSPRTKGKRNRQGD